MFSHKTEIITMGLLGALCSDAQGECVIRYSGFDTGNEGWRVAAISPTAHVAADPGGVTAVWNAALGLPPACIQGGDFIGGWEFLRAAAVFNGDLASRYGKNLEYDIRLNQTDGAQYPAVALREERASPFTIRHRPRR
jgi:hypothetical protein